MKEDERKRTDMELWFDGRSVAVDYTVPNTLNLKQRTPGLKYAPLEVQKAAQNIKISKYANFARNKNHEFVPLVAESLGGLGVVAAGSRAVGQAVGWQRTDGKKERNFL